MASISRGYATTRFGQVHFRSAGERRGERRGRDDGAGEMPLVLLHQTPSSSVMFERLMTALAGEYWAVALDTPGFGGTEALQSAAEGGPRASVALYAEVLAAALERLDIERCWLFGHHAGASIAAQLACDAPALVARLALSGPPLLTQAELERMIPAVSPARLEPDGSHLIAVWDRIRAKDPEAPVELVHREAVLNLHAGVRYTEAYRAVFEHDLGACLRAIACPTLVMAGARDPLLGSVEPAARALQRAATRTTVFPVGGATVCDTHPDLVAAALRGFFRPEGPTSR